MFCSQFDTNMPPLPWTFLEVVIYRLLFVAWPDKTTCSERHNFIFRGTSPILNTLPSLVASLVVL